MSSHLLHLVFNRPSVALRLAHVVVRSRGGVVDVEVVDSLHAIADLFFAAVDLLAHELKEIPRRRNPLRTPRLRVDVSLCLGADALDELAEGVVKAFKVRRCAEEVKKRAAASPLRPVSR